MKDGGQVFIIVGLQYGSEGKGAITSYLAPVMTVGVRTGASNAGHTIYFNGRKFVMHQIPSVWVNPTSILVVGRAAMINLDVLLAEIKTVEKVMPIKDRLFVDESAFVITEDQILREGTGDLDVRIGSTSARSGKGIGQATADKVLRRESCVRACDVAELRPFLADTIDLVNEQLDDGQFVLLEGTQGFHLSLEHGRFPFVTSRDVSATAIAASAGISTHNFETEVIGVVRTYPIRVAGNSGPFGSDSLEVDWGYVSEQSGAAALGQSIVERTSVTNMVRRVATFSGRDYKKSLQVNRPTQIAVTFGDYLDWGIHEQDKVTPPVESFLEELEKMGVPVTLLRTGPRTTIDFEWYRRSILRKLRCHDE